ncbi:hypothetical protein HY991_01515, partial [Candidatus Micrarchaeota archaeon]|nr:hypothetical protein [Candidatus Micrarchaeota archaeon]
MNSFEKLCKEIVGLKGRTLITFHSLGDLEAVASALVLEKAVQNSDARMLDSLNAQAKKVLRELGLEVKP